jgi:hypothetical protein
MRGRVKMLGCCLKRPTGNGRISVLVTIKGTVSFQESQSNFETDALTVDADFFKLWTFKFEYENLKNTNNNNQSNFMTS